MSSLTRYSPGSRRRRAAWAAVGTSNVAWHLGHLRRVPTWTNGAFSRKKQRGHENLTVASSGLVTTLIIADRQRGQQTPDVRRLTYR